MKDLSITNQLLLPDDTWCVIPVYNNAATVREIAQGCRERARNVLVVDDGSMDAPVEPLFSGLDVHVIRHKKNQGKGCALASALNFLAEKDARWMITLDGDGQHKPEDLARFLPLLEDDTALIIGCRDFTRPNIPGSSKFGRSFANFWLRVETGLTVGDCQSGFRAYPVRHFHKLRLSGSYYDFETEALARAAWAGLKLKCVEIDVFYPEPGKRVSSFRPFVDNARISWMHTRLVLRHLLPVPHKKLVSPPGEKMDLSLFVHPIRFLKVLMKENATPEGLAASAVVGIILGTLPLVFTHTIAILYVTARLHLNKIMAVSIQNVCNPPLVPFLCVELGYWLFHGEWLKTLDWETLPAQIPSLLGYWLAGSLVLAPVLAAAVGFLVYVVAKGIQEKNGVPV